jgi:hypothetical protein
LEAVKDVFHHGRLKRRTPLQCDVCSLASTVTDDHQHHLARQAALEDTAAKRCAAIEAQKRAIASVQAEIAAEMQRAVGETEMYYEKITGVLVAMLALENSTDRTTVKHGWTYIDPSLLANTLHNRRQACMSFADKPKSTARCSTHNLLPFKPPHKWVMPIELPSLSCVNFEDKMQ